MKSNTIVAMISVMAIMTASLVIVPMITSDDSDAANPASSASSPLTTFSANAESLRTGTIYITVGASFYLNCYFDEVEGMCSYVDAASNAYSEYGLTISSDWEDPDISGTISKAGTITMVIDNEGNSLSDATVTFVFVDPVYSVVFNGNGATTTSTTVSKGSSCTLPSITKSGYIFNGWYTAASGGTFVGNAGDTYSPSGDITLYAHWTAATINITSASGATDMVQGKTYSHTVTADVSGCTVTVSGASWLTVSGYTISGVPPTTGDYNVTVTLSKTGYTSASQSFTIHVAEVLSFTSSPSAGIIISG